MSPTMQKMWVTTRGLIPLAVIAATSLVACSSSSSSFGGGDSGVDKDTGTKADTGPKKDTGTSTKTDSGKTEDGGSTSPVAAYCTKYLAAEATAAAQCFGGTEADWATQVEGATSCPELAAAVTAGRVTYSATDGAACLQALANISCATVTTPSSEPAACTSTFKGTVAAGGACDSSLDCGTGSFCSGLGGSAGSCTGTCTADLTAGTSCSASDVCTSGTACTGSPTTCTTIPAPVGSGQTCLYDSGSMSSAPACQLGLACDLTTFTCVTPVAPGDPCPTGHGICAPFTYCDPTSKTCKPDPTTGGKCGAAAGEDVIPCIGQNYCKGSGTTATAGTCTALGAGNAACEASLLAGAGAQCASGSCSVSDGGPGTCAAACTKE